MLITWIRLPKTYLTVYAHTKYIPVVHGCALATKLQQPLLVLLQYYCRVSVSLVRLSANRSQHLNDFNENKTLERASFCRRCCHLLQYYIIHSISCYAYYQSMLIHPCKAEYLQMTADKHRRANIKKDTSLYIIKNIRALKKRYQESRHTSRNTLEPFNCMQQRSHKIFPGQYGKSKNGNEQKMKMCRVSINCWIIR